MDSPFVGQALILCLALALPAGITRAEPIVSNVGVLTRLIFTDNLFLTDEGQESAAILQLLPNISGGRTTNRTSYRYYYGPSALFYGGGHSELNKIFQVFQADAAVDIVDQYLGLRFSARANQNLINPQDAPQVSFDALGNPDEFAQTFVVEVTPVLRLPLLRGDFATLQIEPGLNYTFSSDTADGRSNVGNAGTQSLVAIRSGERFSRAPWSIEWTGNSVFDNADQNDYDNQSWSSLIGTVDYRVGRQLMVQGLAGYDFGNYSATDDDSGPRWRITPFWFPSPTTTVAVGYGERYFGNDWFVLIDKEHKKSVFGLRYESTVQSTGTYLLDQDVVEFQNPFGDPINPVTSADPFGSVTNPALVSGVYVSRALTGTYAYRSGRNQFGLTLSQYWREYQNVDGNYNDGYLTALWDRALNQRMSAQLRWDWWRQTSDADLSGDFDQYRVGAQLSYTLSAHLETSLAYSYMQRLSSDDNPGYDENRVILTLSWDL